jgi:hypothetical protein
VRWCFLLWSTIWLRVVKRSWLVQRPILSRKNALNKVSFLAAGVKRTRQVQVKKLFGYLAVSFVVEGTADNFDRQNDGVDQQYEGGKLQVHKCRVDFDYLSDSLKLGCARPLSFFDPSRNVVMTLHDNVQGVDQKRSCKPQVVPHIPAPNAVRDN